jgi:hypothetical protein
MASEIVRTKSIISTTDQSAATAQYTFQKLDSSGQLVACTAGAYSIGVLQDKPKAKDPGAVCYPGDETKVRCGGSFNAGGDVASDANGNAVAATSGGYVLGQAIDAGVSGFIARIIYQPKGSKM